MGEENAKIHQHPQIPSSEDKNSPDKNPSLCQIKLRNSRAVITYGKRPIDVYIGSKHLQIIDARLYDEFYTFNADFLLIDPATFDPKNPTRGFKGIRPNEIVVIGRDCPGRFDLPDTVFCTHLSIRLVEDKKLVITDLNSTNGTVVIFEDPQKISEEIKAQELGPGIKQIFAEFFKYVEKNQPKIQKALMQRQDLADLIYEDFYSQNINNSKYRENDLAIQQLATKYLAQVKTARENLLSKAQRGRGPIPMDNGYWLYINTNDAFRNQSSDGRFYLNPKPEYVVPMFLNIASAFHNAGLHSEIKIPMVGNAETFNRLDKMVIYFSAEELQKVLEIIEDLYHNNSGAFDDTGIPRFTAQVKDKSGTIMTGIGFGEEPLLKNMAFGVVRAKILAEVYLEMKNYPQGSIYNPNLVETLFRRACLKYKIDPQNPAFNLEGLKKFPQLKSRINTYT